MSSYNLDCNGSSSYSTQDVSYYSSESVCQNSPSIVMNSSLVESDFERSYNAITQMALREIANITKSQFLVGVPDALDDFLKKLRDRVTSEFSSRPLDPSLTRSKEFVTQYKFLCELIRLPNQYVDSPRPTNVDHRLLVEKSVQKSVQELWLGEVERALSAVLRNGLLYRSFPESLKRNPQVAIEAVRQNGDVFEYLFEGFKKERIYAEVALKNNGLSARFLLEEQKQDRALARIAIQQDGDALQHFPNFQDDAEMIRIAVANKGSAFRHASLAMKKNVELVLELVSQNPKVYFFISPLLKDHRVIFENFYRQYSALTISEPIFLGDF